MESVGQSDRRPLVPTVIVTSDWQNFSQVPGHPPFVERFAARMPDGRFLELPLRETASIALADFRADQASFLVVDALAEWLARASRPLRPDLVVGLPGAGAILAAETARRLSHLNWVSLADRPLPWFNEALSMPRGSDGAGRTAEGDGLWWLDPVLVPRVRGRRALLVHDALGDDSQVLAAAALLKRGGAASVAIAVAMAQADRWIAALPADVAPVAVFATPSFRLAVGGWVPNEGSAVWRVCPLFRQGAGQSAAGPLPAGRRPAVQDAPGGGDGFPSGAS
jgi:adenine/guanine phosphoribosyltransferase-like PRPP-binding protein